MAPFNQRRPYDPTEDIMRLRSPQVLGQQYDGSVDPSLRVDQQPVYDPSGGEGEDNGNMWGNPQSQQPSMIPQQSQPQIPQQTRQPWDEVTATKDMMKAINQVYTPSTERYDKLNRLLDQAPVDKGRGLGMSILGGIQAFKDPEAAQKMLDQPYTSAKEQWQTKVGPYQQAATLENQQNVNERALAGNVLTNLRSQRNDFERNETSRIRAEAYAFSKTHPDWKYDFSGPNILATNPQNPQDVRIVGQTGHLSDQASIEAKGQIQKDVANILAEGQDARANLASATQGYVAGLAGGTARDIASMPARESPEKAFQTRLQELYYTDKNARQFLTRNSDGSITMSKPPSQGGLFGATNKQMSDYDAFEKKVYPNTAPAPTGTGRPSTFVPPPAPVPIPPRRGSGIGPQQIPDMGGVPQSVPQQVPDMLPPEQSMSPVPPRLNQIADQSNQQNMSPAPDMNQNQSQPTGQSQGFTPRSEYTRGNQGNPNPPTPWFKDAYKNAVTPTTVSPASRSIYQKQEMTPSGPKTTMDNAWKQRIIAELGRRGKQINEDTIRAVMESGEVK